MKKLLLAVGAAFAVWFGAVGSWRALASADTKIRRMFAGCVGAFNARSARGVLDCFALTYRDATVGADHETLRGALAHLLLRARDGVRYRVEIDDASLQMNVDATTARAAFRLALHRGRIDGSEQLKWELDVDTDLVLTLPLTLDNNGAGNRLIDLGIAAIRSMARPCRTSARSPASSAEALSAACDRNACVPRGFWV